MKRLIFVTFISIVSGCGQKDTIRVPDTIAQTSPEERAADNTLSETKDIPSSQSCMTQTERDAFRDLRSAVSLLRSADHEKTAKLDSCNSSLILEQRNMAVCSSALSDLQKKHRFDWLTDWGDMVKGIVIGFVLAFVVLALIKLGIIAGKVGSL